MRPAQRAHFASHHIASCSRDCAELPNGEEPSGSPRVASNRTPRAPSPESVTKRTTRGTRVDGDPRWRTDTRRRLGICLPITKGRGDANVDIMVRSCAGHGRVEFEGQCVDIGGTEDGEGAPRCRPWHVIGIRSRWRNPVATGYNPAAMQIYTPVASRGRPCCFANVNPGRAECNPGGQTHVYPAS